MNQTDTFHITIIGGGITGLSAAFALQGEAAAQDIEITYTLLEKSGRWGGKIMTETVEGFGDEPFVVEAGPDSYLTQKPWAAQLAREISIGDQFLPTNDERRQTFVLNKGKPAKLPDGLMLIVPTKIRPFILSRLISPLGKLRMGLDWFIKPKQDDEDETLADFINRRLGHEALDKIAEPLLSGIYNADADMQSMMATFPRFRDIEKQHGSLIKGMLAAQQARKQAPPNPNGKPSMFTSFKPGMEELVLALREQLTGDCRLGVGVERLETCAERGRSIGDLRSRDWRLGSDSGTVGHRPEHNWEEDQSPISNLQSPITQLPNYQLHLSDDTTLLTNAIILATPAFVAADLLADVAPVASKTLREIRYVSTGTISLAYRRDEIEHPLNGFGIVIPKSEKRRINAITWSSTKFAYRAPEGYVLLRVFFGGSRTPEMMAVPDEELVSIVRQELAEIMGVETEPAFQRIYRWDRSNPQYDVGHLDRVEIIRQSLPEGLVVTGSPYGGVGVPDCVRQARETAVSLIQSLALAAKI